MKSVKPTVTQYKLRCQIVNAHLFTRIVGTSLRNMQFHTVVNHTISKAKDETEPK